MTVRTLHLIRHGNYDTSVLNGVDEVGGNLTEKGQKQAQFVAELFSTIPIRNIYASSLPRAKETAQIIAEKLQLNVETSDLLQEAIPSIPPGMGEVIGSLLNVKLQVAHQTVKKHLERSEQAFKTFFFPPEKGLDSYHDILVCHGNIIRYFVCKVLDVDINTWIRLEINHCGISAVSIEDSGTMRLISHNETKHLPPKLQSI